MSVLWHDVRHIIKSSRVEFVWISLLIGFLLFVLNMFVGVGVGAQEFSRTLNSKLGMYFYIVDDPDRTDEIYSQVIELQSQLELAGLETSFQDKDTALNNLLGDANSDLIDRFDEFGLGNPLPATLNVVFEGEEELRSLKSILVDHTDIITNIRDIANPTTLQEQEMNNLTAINLGYVVMSSAGVVVLVMVIGIITFLMYLLKSKFINFKDTIQIKKLMGAHYSQIILPFVITTNTLLIIGYIIMFILSVVALSILDYYLGSLLQIDLRGAVRDYTSSIVAFLLLQLLVLRALGGIIARLYSYRLITRTA